MIKSYDTAQQGDAIEITPEMIEAGARILDSSNYLGTFDQACDDVRCILKACFSGRVILEFPQPQLEPLTSVE